MYQARVCNLYFVHDLGITMQYGYAWNKVLCL